jgi:hypothetical protein
VRYIAALVRKKMGLTWVTDKVSPDPGHGQGNNDLGHEQSKNDPGLRLRQF